jgi:hypothetical protein
MYFKVEDNALKLQNYAKDAGVLYGLEKTGPDGRYRRCHTRPLDSRLVNRLREARMGPQSVTTVPTLRPFTRRTPKSSSRTLFGATTNTLQALATRASVHAANEAVDTAVSQPALQWESGRSCNSQLLRPMASSKRENEKHDLRGSWPSSEKLCWGDKEEGNMTSANAKLKLIRFPWLTASM